MVAATISCVRLRDLSALCRPNTLSSRPGANDLVAATI
jgi:hypothetical protein